MDISLNTQPSIKLGSLYVCEVVNIRISTNPIDSPSSRRILYNEDQQGTLPPRWARHIRPFLETLYIGHNTQITTWNRPIPEDTRVAEPKTKPNTYSSSRYSTPLRWGENEEEEKNESPPRYTSVGGVGDILRSSPPEYSSVGPIVTQSDPQAAPRHSSTSTSSSAFKWIRVISTSDEGLSCQYRQRGERPDALGGFSDVFRADVRYSDGTTGIVGVFVCHNSQYNLAPMTGCGQEA